VESYSELRLVVIADDQSGGINPRSMAVPIIRQRKQKAMLSFVGC